MGTYGTLPIPVHSSGDNVQLDTLSGGDQRIQQTFSGGPMPTDG